MKTASKVIRMAEEMSDLRLDPMFFTDLNKLKPEIISVLQEVIRDVIAGLAERGVDLTPVGAILTGSLTSINYDQWSDVDLHILVDFSEFGDPQLMKNFFTFFAKDFNGNYDLRGRNIELYFQDKDEPHVSPGIYDILKDKWIMPPNGKKIVRTSEMTQAADSKLNYILGLKAEWEEINRSDKDAVRKFQTKITNYFEALRKMRKDGISTTGLDSVGNQVFKLLRRNGGLEVLSKLMLDVQNTIFEALNVGA